MQLLGRKGAVELVAGEIMAPDAESAQVGVVVALPLAIDGLHRWLAEPGNGEWLSGQLTTLGAAPHADVAGLLDDAPARSLGTDLSYRLFGDYDHVHRSVAGRARLTRVAAGELMALALAAIATYLTDEDGYPILPSGLTSIVDDEYRDVLDAGWQPWIDQATAVNRDTGMISAIESTAATDDVVRRTINLGRRRQTAPDTRTMALGSRSASEAGRAVSVAKRRSDRPPLLLMAAAFVVVAALLAGAWYLATRPSSADPATDTTVSSSSE